MIRVSREDGVALLSLRSGTTNALGLELVSRLAGEIRAVEADPALRSLVLTSASDRFFSIGWNLPELLRMEREAFTGYLRAFNRLSEDLFALPMPTVAALPGHAVAGGCILALCCDYRHIAAGRKLMGLNEIKLGVPIPLPGECMLREVVGPRASRDIVESGEFFEPEEALRMGLVDRVLPPERVLPVSLARAAALGAMPGGAYRAIKRRRTERVRRRIDAGREECEREFLDCWFSEVARERLAEAAEKF